MFMQVFKWKVGISEKSVKILRLLTNTFWILITRITGFLKCFTVCCFVGTQNQIHMFLQKIFLEHFLIIMGWG